jgi:hypothetical protein
MVITILPIIINRLMTDLYFVRRIASRYYCYLYVKLVIGIPIKDFTLLQRFTNDNNHLTTSYNHLIIIITRITTYPTILTP